MVESALPVPGDIVAGKYRIDSIIGQGGMGVVLGAFDQSLGRQVAIKFLHPSRAANEASAARFGREARAAASLQSEHVVRVHEVGALPNGAPFIVMEHLTGSDLATVLHHRGGLPVDFACDLVLQTCEALAQAHARGIVHRDLKPQNLFLTQRPDGGPCVKVLDFGISKAADTDESSPKLTSTEMVMGTPLYMSPEQVRSLKNLDHRADIWALGAILFELLAATPPFDGPSASALHAAIAMDPPQPLRARRPDLPQHIEAAVLRCLEKDPARRFQTVHELAAAIAPFASEYGRASAKNLGGATGSSPRIVSLPPPAGGFGNASTMNVQSSWQQATTPGPPAKRANVGLIVAGLVAGGLLLLFVVGGATAFYVLRAPAVTITETETVPSAKELPPPVPSISPEHVAPAMTTSAAPVVSHAPPPPARDAGAPAAKKDAGGGASQDEIDRDIAARAQGSCNHQRFMLAAAKTDAERKRWAESNRLTQCLAKPAIRCQRDLCRDACNLLGTEQCRMHYELLERSSPAKY